MSRSTLTWTGETSCRARSSHIQVVFLLKSAYVQPSAQKRIKMMPSTSKRTSTEVFECEVCGVRKRLESAKRHWCDVCTRGTPVEMRRTRDKWKTASRTSGGN